MQKPSDVFFQVHQETKNMFCSFNLGTNTYFSICPQIHNYIFALMRDFAKAAKGQKITCRLQCGKHTALLLPHWAIETPYTCVAQGFSPFGNSSLQKPLQDPIAFIVGTDLWRSRVVSRKIFLNDISQFNVDSYLSILKINVYLFTWKSSIPDMWSIFGNFRSPAIGWEVVTSTSCKICSLILSLVW